MTIHIARPRSGLVTDEGGCVNGDVPDGGLAEMEQAQAALRDGIERARQVLRKAKLEIATLDGASYCGDTIPNSVRAQAEHGQAEEIGIVSPQLV